MAEIDAPMADVDFANKIKQTCLLIALLVFENKWLGSTRLRHVDLVKNNKTSKTLKQKGYKNDN